MSTETKPVDGQNVHVTRYADAIRKRLGNSHVTTEELIFLLLLDHVTGKPVDNKTPAPLQHPDPIGKFTPGPDRVLVAGERILKSERL